MLVRQQWETQLEAATNCNLNYETALFRAKQLPIVSLHLLQNPARNCMRLFCNAGGRGPFPYALWSDLRELAMVHLLQT